MRYESASLQPICSQPPPVFLALKSLRLPHSFPVSQDSCHVSPQPTMAGARMKDWRAAVMCRPTKCTCAPWL
ncbi:hypothetical protein PBY51_016627 [Eleginops maclovinus]|uniref:Uncharacterized protein n=1 Tax=Eleginops maclovinus TaxID=56733 RepID=A0AAN7WKQ5_ELEMC|nr:hypothetical protein PBY51_016627 [Eleginops maclovinus]